MHDALAAADMRPVTDDFYVAGQISADDVPALVEAGFRTLICNRPDGEADDQTPFSEIESVAKKVGLNVHYIPVLTTGLTMENVDATRAVLADAETPIFAYCRSGGRSTQAYQITKQHGG